MIVKRWFLALGAISVAIAGAGASLLVTHDGDKPSAKVLGEKITGSGSSESSASAQSAKNDKTANDKKDFTIGGGVTGLYPGANKTLTVTFTNPNGSGIEVDSLRIQAASSPTGCAGSNLTFSGFQNTPVPGKGTATLDMTVHMADTVGNNCGGTSWVLTYTGTATKA